MTNFKYISRDKIDHIILSTVLKIQGFDFWKRQEFSFIMPRTDTLDKLVILNIVKPGGIAPLQRTIR